MSKYRWFIAIFFAVSMHGLFFLMKFAESEIIPPKPSAIQRIAVSLGEKKVVKKTVQKQGHRETPQKKIVRKPKPQTPVQKQFTPKPVVIPTPKPQKKIVQEIAPTPVPEEVEFSLVTPSPVVQQSGAPPVSSETAALVKQASPLYQINPPPKYPRMARRRGLQGVVVVEVLVDTAGRVAQLRLSQSSGHTVLDKAALRAVRGWRFGVGTIGGTPRQMWVKVPVRFQLQ